MATSNVTESVFHLHCWLVTEVLTAVTISSTIFWLQHCEVRRLHDVYEEHIASTRRVEELAKQETNVACLCSCFWLGLVFDNCRWATKICV